MATFRRRTEVIEAVNVQELVDCAINNWSKLPEWVRNEYEAGNIMFWYNGILFKDSRGDMHLRFNDWLVRGDNGYIYSWRGENFDEAYERAN